MFQPFLVSCFSFSSFQIPIGVLISNLFIRTSIIVVSVQKFDVFHRRISYLLHLVFE